MTYELLYSRLGVPKGQFLFQKCPCAKSCWQGLPETAKGKYNTIYQPFVGPQYDKTKIVVIAENMFEYGGWDSVLGLVDDARKELPHRRRVRFENDYKDYRGSYLWLWLGSYGIAMAERLGYAQAVWENGMPAISSVCQGFDYLAYTNHVKCSPCGNRKDRGRPSEGMWQNCGALILKNELALLAPIILLVMGKSTNIWSFRNHVFDKRTQLNEHGSALFGEAPGPPKHPSCRCVTISVIE